MAKKQINIIENSWIDWTQFILIALLAPFFLFPSVKYIWIFFVIPSIWTWRWLIKKNFFERSILDWTIFILVIQVFITCLIVPDLAFSLPKIAGVLFGIFFFYSVIALLKTEKLIKAAVILFLGGNTIFSLLSFLGMFTMREKHLGLLMKIKEKLPHINFNLPGAEEGFHPNAVGGTLIIIIPLCFILVFLCSRKDKMNNLIYKNKIFLIFLSVSLFIMVLALILTQSRGSWIGLLLSSSIILFTNKRWKKWGTILIFISVFIYLILIGFNKIPISAQETKGKIIGRIQLWNIGIETIGKHPVFGIGMNRVRNFPEVGYKQAHVHNHLLHIGAELGIPGLVAYLAIMIGAGFMCIETWRKSDVGWMRMMALGLGWGQLAHFIFGMGDSIPLGAKVGIFFWFSLGLIAAIYNYTIRQGRSIA